MAAAAFLASERGDSDEGCDLTHVAELEIGASGRGERLKGARFKTFMGSGEFGAAAENAAGVPTYGAYFTLGHDGEILGWADLRDVGGQSAEIDHGFASARAKDERFE